MDRQPGIWDHCLQQAAVTDVGLRRSNNQDSMAVALAASQERFESRGHVFMVADGMGAHAAGELASKLATDVVPLTYHKLVDLSPPEALREAVRQANQHINGRGEADREFRGMGTTVDTLVLVPQGALIAHVGDSRVYRLRDECLEQLTFDHSLVWEMRAAGHLSDKEEDVPSFIPRNVITRSMGPNPQVEIDLEGPFPVQVGDTFLLCSDGLSGQVTDSEIGQVLTCLEPEEAAQTLVHLANLRGGPDNITVVVVRVAGPQVLENVAARPNHFENGAGSKRPVPTSIWAILGMFVLAAVFLAFMDQFLFAGTSLLVALLGFCGTLAYHLSPPSATSFDSRPRGKAPYRQTLCAVDMDFVNLVRDFSRQLHEAGEKESWTIEWETFRNSGEIAEEALEKGDLISAAREYLRAIRDVMQQLKQQRARNEENRAAGIF